MIEIIAILVCGVLLGRLLSSVKAVKKFAEGMSYTVWILIFVLGYSVGADSYVMGNIQLLLVLTPLHLPHFPRREVYSRPYLLAVLL